MENWRELLKDKPVKYWIRTEIEEIIKDKSVDRERFYEYSAKRTIMNPVVTDYTLKRRLVQHCVNNDEFSACSLRQRRVVVSQRCHRIASLLRLALTQISGADIHRYLRNAVLRNC